MFIKDTPFIKYSKIVRSTYADF